MFQHELFVHSVAALPRRCASFTFVYILPSKSPNCILFIKQYFQIKIINDLHVYSIIPEAWNIQACGIHVVMQLTWTNTLECSGNRVAILDYFNLDLDFW